MTHARHAAEFVAHTERARWHDDALWYVREKRDTAARRIPEWEPLREAAAAIKRHTVAHLADHLERFEQNAQRLGAHVHWARDAEEHNEIVLELLRERDVRRVVKSKSMLTEECQLNPHLERHGIEVTDTDLGERIVQFRSEPPSHIIFPAIHLKRGEIGQLFHEKLGTEPGLEDPTRLTQAARAHLRNKFLEADAGLTGANFAIAETGGLVIVTNEGNADLGTSIPPLHIASLGIEKIIPRSADLGVFLRLLARSATGQAMSVYTSHFHGPRPDGELHIVLVDNGRTQLRADETLRDALSCIRCGACLNTCPVFRRSGGYSYQTPVPGPIGSVLSPSRDPEAHASLPHACSLCGSCSDVCPVKIPLHHQLLAWRGRLTEIAPRSRLERLAYAGFARSLLNVRRFRALAGLGRWFLRRLPRGILYHRANAWGRQRELPEIPKQSFRDAYAAGEHRERR
ncbi:lactate utilization protein [Myxococcota bacterium]|nr:lactate utilization protein [Myxococcota bacterium]